MRPVGGKLFHAEGLTDGRKDRRTNRETDMTKLIVPFRSFANALKTHLKFRGGGGGNALHT
jgi:hypothetical protein